MQTCTFRCFLQSFSVGIQIYIVIERCNNKLAVVWCKRKTLTSVRQHIIIYVTDSWQCICLRFVDIIVSGRRNDSPYVFSIATAIDICTDRKLKLCVLYLSVRMRIIELCVCVIPFSKNTVSLSVGCKIKCAPLTRAPNAAVCVCLVFGNTAVYNRSYLSIRCIRFVC